LKEKKKKEYLLDTSCWFEWHKQSPIGKKIEKKLKNEIKYTPTAAIGELRKIIRDERFFKVKAFVLQNSETVPCDDNISELAGQLKKDSKVKRVGWVDHIMVATAKVKTLTVCSTDHHFDGFKKIIDIIVFE